MRIEEERMWPSSLHGGNYGWAPRVLDGVLRIFIF